MNGKSYLENLEHYIEGEETEIERGETRDSRGAVSDKDRRLNRICGAKGLSCEFREREREREKREQRKCRFDSHARTPLCLNI